MRRHDPNRALEALEVIAEAGLFAERFIVQITKEKHGGKSMKII
jgi:hypothetical protein